MVCRPKVLGSSNTNCLEPEYVKDVVTSFLKTAELYCIVRYMKTIEVDYVSILCFYQRKFSWETSELRSFNNTTSPHCITSRRIRWHHVTWEHITQHRIKSHHMTGHKESHHMKWHWHDTTSHHMTWHLATNHTTWPHVTSQPTTSSHLAANHITAHYITTADTPRKHNQPPKRHHQTERAAGWCTQKPASHWLVAHSIGKFFLWSFRPRLAQLYLYVIYMIYYEPSLTSSLKCMYRPENNLTRFESSIPLGPHVHCWRINVWFHLLTIDHGTSWDLFLYIALRW